jgi:saccharopine dehydrogenase (NAD+, L-lysine-forming)
MGKVLVIGAGGVGTVVVHKMASLPEVFTEPHRLMLIMFRSW